MDTHLYRILRAGIFKLVLFLRAVAKRVEHRKLPGCHCCMRLKSIQRVSKKEKPCSMQAC